MENQVTDIYQHKAGSLINKLVEFLGERNVKRCLQRYERSLKSSGPVFREYYLKNKHPWLNALTQYYELTKKAKSIHKNLTPELKDLATDAKKVVDLQHQMPKSVKNKYKKDLLDDNNACYYLFEIQTAWHFFAKNWAIQWYEDVPTKHPEFLIEAPELQFNVECKWISVNIARKIHRKDLYSLADNLIPEIEKRKYAGRLDFILKDRLEGGIISGLCTKVLELIDGGALKGEHEISPFGILALDLSCVSGLVVGMNECWKRFYERKPDKAHGGIFARSKDGRPVDPIELTVMSEKADTVLDGIKDKISKAEMQLDESKPGLIVCFLEGVNGFELRKLNGESALQRMTEHVLAKDKFSYVMGIAYSSESMVKKGYDSEEIFNPGLFFRNHKCTFQEAKTFEFLSPPRF